VVLHQFIFWSYRKKAVPLQRNLKHNLHMKIVLQNLLARMALFTLWFMSAVFMCIACTPDGQHSFYTPLSPESFVSGLGSGNSTQNKEERDRVLKDTITPPNNPMYELPYIPETFTFRGVLQLEYFMGELYCVMRTLQNDYFMIDNGIKYFYRLDNPLLENYAVGDTIIVTAKPMKLLDDFSLATYYVQPNFPSGNE
jgi:hypothetical protein